MQLLNAVQNEAILSNVGEIGEFRIRNSAKAFNILSSGLYANKVRAIIRELSCNAIDSHVAAGKQDTPFDVHLPTQLEPWFSIRDYGTGLSHEQVTQIYTTYFESTKTTSNEFIGALGLGSKSPFAYTDNFTVTAIQSGKKGIYTAFINENGVPSIALMMTEETDEPAGVEVKFSVNDRWDFSKFVEEAHNVYKWFKHRPVITGVDKFTFEEVEYETKDIIPGVHSRSRTYGGSFAVMGNIAYPIQIPEADKTLGTLRTLLGCGLVIEFAIGELDFQASREGLSYIPQTIASIKSKLLKLNGALADKLAVEANAIENLWLRTTFLIKKKEHSLWTAAVEKYATDTKFPFITVKPGTYEHLRGHVFKLSEEDLHKKYNIMLRGFEKSRGNRSTSALKSYVDYSNNGTALTSRKMWDISVSDRPVFIINDTKVGAYERAKYHWNNTPMDKDGPTTNYVFILEAYDRSKPVDSEQFLKDLSTPPTVKKASELSQKERRVNSATGKNVTILKLEEKGYGGYHSQKDMVWRDAGKADSFDANTTYYYLPLSGFTVQSSYGLFDVKRFYNDLRECGIASLRQQTVFGVRKSDIEFIKTQKNWVNIEEHIAASLKVVDNKLVMSLVIDAIDRFNLLSYNNSIVEQVTNQNSPYVKLVNQFKGYERVRYSENSLKNLCRMYAKDVNFNPDAVVKKFTDECAIIQSRYPLLQYLRSAPNAEVANYINLIDSQKGVK